MVNIQRKVKQIEDADFAVRRYVLNELIEKAFNPSASQAEQSVRMTFNAQLLTELRERKLWPMRD